MTDAAKPLRQLLEAAYLQTVAQKLEWVFDPVADSCSADLGAGSIEVLQEADQDGDYYAYVQIRNSQQEVIDTIYGGSLGKGAKPFNTAHREYWELMRDLRAQAYRSAMGADKIVSSMLSALGAEHLALGDDVSF